MRIAVISDIHSNLEAFEAVLEDIEVAAADEIVSLGDNIGYGADPEAVMQLVCREKIPSVLGNHELALLDAKSLFSFNRYARKAFEINRDMLSEKSASFIGTFDKYMVRHGARFVHGFPPASQTVYVTYTPDADIAEALESIPERLSFVGHTHFMRGYRYKGGTVEAMPLDEKGIALDKNSRYIINTGSVGQPRDGEPSAKYVIWDSGTNRVAPRYVPYDNKTAAEKIKESGIPKIYADLIRAAPL